MSGFDHYLSLRQKQELALKPKMLQSLKMLALPILELEAYIKQELVNNPLLELREEKDDEDIDEGSFDATAPESSVSIEESETCDQASETLSEARELTDILDQWNDFHMNYEGRQSDNEMEHSETLIMYEDDSREKYLQQLYPLDLSEAETDYITELFESCDNYGFLPEAFSIVNLGRQHGLNSRRSVELHQILMGLSPKGIGARNLAECLMAQLTEEQLENHVLVGMINEQFENLIHRRYQKIASFYGVSEATIMNLRSQIAQLDPKPGMRLAPANAAYVYPDVTLKLIDDEYVVIINDHITPNIIISQRYRKLISRGCFDKETMQFVRERINSAKFLIKSIFMRMRTLERVSLSIVKHQRDFFYNSSGVMIPLTYAAIAQDLGVSESTISRVVKHKYMETPYGIFAFKDFFNSKAGKDENYDSVSRQRVKSKMLKLIESEDKASPYSDQDLVDQLRMEGLDISRRIIAKYRDELGILNSRLRKK